MSTRAPTGLQNEVEQLHISLMNSSGHRANILNDNFREIGVGLEVGQYQSFEAAFVTQNFAKTASNSFLTGVAFDDLDGDKRYDINEGLGNFTVSATNEATGAITTTQSNVAGGYELELASGNYTVSFSGDGFATTTLQVSIGSKNVKQDLIDPVERDSAPTPEPVSPPPSDATSNDALGSNTSTEPSSDDVIPEPEENSDNTVSSEDDNDILDDDIINSDRHNQKGNDDLFGGDGNDILRTDHGDHNLTGNNGNDIFGFYALDHFQIQDFSIGQDRLFFDSESLGINGIAQLESYITGIDQSANGVTIEFGPEASIHIVGINFTDITADMIMFNI